jgi:hypothetical protein
LRARYFHVTARNEHWRLVASDCRAFLESWSKVPEEGKRRLVHRVPPVELKFRGVTSATVSIGPGPGQQREFDAVYIFDDHPSIAFIGINPYIVDSGQVRDQYTIRGKGEYELIYRIQSRELPTARITLTLVLGDDLKSARLFDPEAGNDAEEPPRSPIFSSAWGGEDSSASSTPTYGTVSPTISLPGSGIPLFDRR